MNRNSLLGRLSSKFAAGGSAERAKAFRPQIEPLEVRRVLATFYVNDTWEKVGAGDLMLGDTIQSSAADVATGLGTITAFYGFDGFGTVTNTATQTLAGGATIYDAINTIGANAGNTVSILEGTYTESDIVVDKAQLVVKGTGRLGTPTPGGAPYVTGSDTLIVPEIASAKTEGEFPTGTHSGFIIYAKDVELLNFRLDGSAGPAGAFNYHQGITTYYESQDGVNGVGGTDYNTIRAGSLELPQKQDVSVQNGTTIVNATAHQYADGDDIYFYSNNNTDGTVTGGDGVSVAHRVPSPLNEGQQYWVHVIDTDHYSLHNSEAEGLSGANPIGFTNTGYGTITTLNSAVYGGIENNKSGIRAQIQIHHVTVENAWYHGITLSGPAGLNFDADGGDNSDPDNEVFKTIVNNIGDGGNQGITHIGILIQNVDGYETGDPGGAPAAVGGNAYQNVVSNAGVGIASNAYGTRSWNDSSWARNDSTYSFNTITNAKVEAYRMEFLSGGDFIANTAIFTNNGVGIGIHGIQFDGSVLGNVIGTPNNAPLIGMKIENSNSQSLFPGGTANNTFANTTFQGPGTGVAGSVGILADNSYGTNANSNFIGSYRTIVTGWQTGVKSVQSVASSVPNTMYLDRLQVAGNAVGFQFGPNVAGGSVQVFGQVNTPDPINDPDGTTMLTGWTPDQAEATANGLQSQPVPLVYQDGMFILSGPASVTSLVTTSLAYNWPTGQGVRIEEDDTTPNHHMPAGIGRGTRYWIHSTGSNTFTLHNSQADAINNVNPLSEIDFSIAVGAVGITELIVPGTPGLAQPAYVITDPVKAKTDVTTSGNLTLGNQGTWVPLLGGNATGSVTINDFSGTETAWLSTSSDLDHVNPWGPGFVPVARLGFWSNITQFGTGQINIASGSGQSVEETGGVYQLTTTPHDASEMGYLRVIAKKGLGSNSADEFLVSIVDIDGTSDLHYFPMSAMNSSSYTTFYSNVLTPSIRFVDGDNLLNLSQIAGWAVSGAFGSTDGVTTTDRMSMIVDDISYVPTPRSSSIDVTGTVNITGAVLAPLDASVERWVSTIGQTFTILNNDGADPIVGTFAGLPEGATVNGETGTYSISYVGGTGNDIVLTQNGEVVTNSIVEGRHLFYNQSFYDGNNAGIQATIAGANNDDNDARDASLSAYLPGSGAASELNMSSYDKGINGIMIDLSTGVDHSGLTLANVANNFTFKVGNDNTPANWAVAPAPTGLSMTPGGGVSGSDRVTITWGTGAIVNKWLEVGVLPTAQTGLAATALTVDPDGPGAGTAVAAGDVFFFGNARGDGKTGNSATGVTVDAADELIARNNPKGAFNPALVDNDYDYNKDKLVDAADQLIARNNPVGAFTPIRKINIGTAGPLAPEGDGGDSGIASALASTATTATPSISSSDLPPGIAHRLEGLDLNSGRIASFFQHLADQDTPGTRKILTKIDAVADELGLDHELLDSLLVDLGLE